jgi:organic hydroperoxide reductase OsmC/OhrA
MTMSVNVLYRTQATATGGRDGKSATKDGAFQVDLSTPKELGGAGVREITQSSSLRRDMRLASLAQ